MVEDLNTKVANANLSSTRIISHTEFEEAFKDFQNN